MGAIEKAGEGTILIRQTGPSAAVEYSINDGVDWDPVPWPCTVTNTSPAAGFVIVSFTTDITLTGTNVNDQFFICGSDTLQFGDNCLRTNGTRPTITISGANAYPGLVKNGSDTVDGKGNISIRNLVVNADNSSLANYSGWIGHPYFGKGTFGSEIIYCASTGIIGSFSGGITGAYTAAQFGRIYIQYCSSEGNIGNSCGGIVGPALGYVGRESGTGSGVIQIHNCYSKGEIREDGGGIVGSTADSAFELYVEDCYSQGDILGSGAGGIVGSGCGASGNSIVNITRCYSEGAISGPDTGGIVGAGTYDGINVVNCYSAGAITGGGAGGILTGGDTSTGVANCYVANDAWDDTAAATALHGVPSPITGYGTDWIQPNGLGSPYLLSSNHGTPSPYGYCLENVKTANIVAGEATPAAVMSGYTHQILQINSNTPSAYPYITIDPATGAIKTAAETAGRIFIIYVFSHKNPYSVTEWQLTVTEAPQPASGCCTPIPAGLDYDVRADMQIGRILNSGIAAPPRYSSYEEYIKKRIAAAARS